MRSLRTAALGAALMLLTASALLAQGFGHRGGGFGPGGLLMIPEVQVELKISEAQSEALKQLSQEMRERAGEHFKGFQDLSSEERDARRATFDALYNEKIGEILDKKQRIRLKQLNIQREGYRGLGRKELADKLDLSSDQRQRIRDTMDGEREAWKRALEAMQISGVMTPQQREDAKRKFGEVRSATDAKLAAILTEGQKRQFQAMQGAPFKFPERRRRPE